MPSLSPPAAQPLSKLIFKFSLSILISYLIFNMLVGFYFVFFPIMKRSAEDFASLIINNADIWQSATAPQKEKLSQHLLNAQNIIFSTELNYSAAEKTVSFLPYIYLLKQKIKKQKNLNVQIDYYPEEKYQHLISLHNSSTNNSPLYIYFQQSQIGTSPPYVILSILLSSILISILASYLIAHRLDKYLQPLINASIKLSKGEAPEKIDMAGPAEIQLLSSSFNKMSRDVHQLLENRTTLLAGVSHNLRTPVARIKLALELLPGTTDPQLKNKIDKSLDEIDNTIGQFLKMAEGMSTSNPQSMSLNKIIQAVISRFEHLDRRIIFTPGSDYHCKISAIALEQILLNLIENSLRYAQGSDINITTKQTRDNLQINIIDHGPGIPEAIKDTLFQPFVSQPPAAANANPIAGGSGLGLAICQIIVRAHQWQLTLTSPASEGGNNAGGTCACIRIPLTDAQTSETLCYKSPEN